MTEEEKDKSVALFDKEVESFCKETFIKDEETKGLIFCCAIHFTNWQKEQTINKACEWLQHNAEKYNASYRFPDCPLLKDFKHAMKNEH